MNEQAPESHPTGEGNLTPMTSILRQQLNSEQMALLKVVYAPFRQSGQWPIWQYVDLTLDQAGIDAASVLASLPVARASSERVLMQRGSYSLVGIERAEELPAQCAIPLTVAGLWHLEEAAPLTDVFLDTVRYLVTKQGALAPDPRCVVSATVSSEEVNQKILAGTIGSPGMRSEELLLSKLGRLLEREPILWSSMTNQSQDFTQWEILVPDRLRILQDLTGVEDYVDRITGWVAPAVAPTEPLPGAPLDLPYAIGYLDAVWKNRTNHRLFTNFDVASVALLTQSGTSQEEFNSRMSALADVLGQVAIPGHPPRQSGGLEAVREYLTEHLDTEAAERIKTAFDTLITLRHLRVSAQHSDKRHRAVSAFEQLGLPYPPPSWEQAWGWMTVRARGALDAIREEVHTGLHAT